MNSMKRPDPMDVFVGERVRALRAMKKMSQTDLGRHLGITFQQVQKYEKGANRISAGRLAKIAELFGAKVADFYPNTGDGNSDIALKLEDPCHKMSLTTRGMRVAIAFNRLRPSHQEIVVAVAEGLSSK